MTSDQGKTMLFLSFIRFFKTLSHLLQASFIEISFFGHNAHTLENYQQTYAGLTAPHPKFKIIPHKIIGVALIDFSRYSSFEAYYQSINGKNSAAYYARKALKNKFIFKEIDRNDYIDDIYAINTSAWYRQGRLMSQAYTSKKSHYHDLPNYRYFGVTTSENHLVAYCYLAFYGEVALVTNFLGHKQFLNFGIMYLLMLEVNKLLLASQPVHGVRFLMYDTYFGASDGLKKFKQKLGFKPYHVKWRWPDCP